MTKQEYEAKVLSLKGTHDYNMLCFIRGEYIASLEAEIAQLQADNRSLVEQVNQMALKPNQEIIEWHNYPEEKPEKTGYYIIYYTILNRVTFDFWHNDKQEWDKYGEYILTWACLPKGVTNEHKTN